MYAVILSKAVNIPFEIPPLDCDPFYHGYGWNFRETKLTIGIQKHPLMDINGKLALIPSYITRGSGFILLGNESLHLSYQTGPENILRIPSGVGRIFPQQLFLRTYFEAKSSHRSDAGRTYLFVLTLKVSAFSTLLTSSVPNSRLKKEDTEKSTVAANEKRFYCKLHG